MNGTCRSAGLLMTAALALTNLNSCYFNSAGHLIHKASHEEFVPLTAVNSASQVYFDGMNYYTTVSCFSEPVYWFHDPLGVATGEDSSWKHDDSPVAEGSVLVRLSTPLALYLTGQSKKPYQPTATDITLLPQERLNVQTAKRFPIRQTINSESISHRITRSSPNAPAWYTLAAVDWLCVDLPVTCVQNAISLPILVLMSPEIVIEHFIQQQQQQQAVPEPPPPTTIRWIQQPDSRQPVRNSSPSERAGTTKHIESPPRQKGTTESPRTTEEDEQPPQETPVEETTNLNDGWATSGPSS